MSTADPSSTHHNSTTTTTKRAAPPTTTNAHPKPPTSIHPTAVIAAHALLTGTHRITIAAGAVLHPYAKVSSAEGPVVVGEGCVVWERAIVGTVGGGEGGGRGAGAGGRSMGRTGEGRGEEEEEGGRQEEAGRSSEADGNNTVELGRNVVVESGAAVEAGAELGEGTVVEACARIGRGAVLGKHCKLAPFSTLPANATVPDFTILHGSDQRRGDKTTQANAVVLELKEQGHEKQLAVLRKLIPSNLAKWQ